MLGYEEIKKGCRAVARLVRGGDLSEADALVAWILNNGASVHDVRSNLDADALRTLGTWRKGNEG